MQRTFIYLLPYDAKAKQTKGAKEAEALLEQLILENPARGSLISGTGGIRKVRVADKKAAKGKSGGFRFWYLDIEQAARTYVLWVIRKGEAENISKAVRNELHALATILKKEKRYAKK